MLKHDDTKIKRSCRYPPYDLNPALVYFCCNRCTKLCRINIDTGNRDDLTSVTFSGNRHSGLPRGFAAADSNRSRQNSCAADSEISLTAGNRNMDVNIQRIV